MNAPSESRRPTSFIKACCSSSLVLLIFLVVIWVTLGRNASEKIATALAMPTGLLWILLTSSVFWAFAARQRKTGLILSLVWTTFTLTGNGIVMSKLAHTLERPFTSIQPLEEQRFDVVVLLGGGASLGGNGRQQGNGAGDRLILTAQLYHRGLTDRIICTGRRIAAMDETGFDPATQSREVLINLNVPSDAIELLGGRTTAAEMKALGKRFSDSGQRVGLVTSAWHLRRAMRLAGRNNFHPQPLPADFMTRPPASATPGQIINACIPQGDAQSRTAKIVKEYLGTLVGR